MMTSDFATVSQAASLLGYSVQHTRLLIRTGKLKAIKLGRDWLIPKQELDRNIPAPEQLTR